MQAGFEQHGDIRTVIYDEQGAGLAAHARNLSRGIEDRATPVRLVPELQNIRASLQKSRRRLFQRKIAGVETSRIQDRVHPRQL